MLNTKPTDMDKMRKWIMAIKPNLSNIVVPKRKKDELSVLNKIAGIQQRQKEKELRRLK